MYLLLASLLAKNFPKMLIPSVLSELADSMAKIVFTHSYNTALPEFLALLVLAATYVRISDTSSDNYRFSWHIILKNLSISI